MARKPPRFKPLRFGPPCFGREVRRGWRVGPARGTARGAGCASAVSPALTRCASDPRCGRMGSARRDVAGRGQPARCGRPGPWPDRTHRADAVRGGGPAAAAARFGDGARQGATAPARVWREASGQAATGGVAPGAGAHRGGAGRGYASTCVASCAVVTARVASRAVAPGAVPTGPGVTGRDRAGRVREGSRQAASRPPPMQPAPPRPLPPRPR